MAYHGCTVLVMSENKNTRSERLNIRVSVEEKERLRLAAENARRSMSNFVIDSALAKADEVLEE